MGSNPTLSASKFKSGPKGPVLIYLPSEVWAFGSCSTNAAAKLPVDEELAKRVTQSHPLRQTTKNGPIGPFFGLSRRVRLRMRTLFDSSTGEAGIEDAQRPSHPLRQICS